jgi:hypothetical protein
MQVSAYGEGSEAGITRPLKIEIFDPPMCCPTGICGPAVDPALLDIYGAVLKIKTEYDGRVVVERYVLGQQPAKFMQQPEVIRRLKADGIAVLPVTVVNGVVLKEKVYPSYEELKQWIEDASRALYERS